MTKAIGILSQCRKTLIYSYIFTFYLEESNQGTILDNRKDVQTVTEALSDYCERDMTRENFKYL